MEAFYVGRRGLSLLGSWDVFFCFSSPFCYIVHIHQMRNGMSSVLINLLRLLKPQLGPASLELYERWFTIQCLFSSSRPVCWTQKAVLSHQEFCWLLVLDTAKILYYVNKKKNIYICRRDIYATERSIH